MEVHGVCACKDWRAEGEGPESEASGHLRIHLPSAAVRRAAAQTPDPAQVTDRVRPMFYQIHSQAFTGLMSTGS